MEIVFDAASTDQQFAQILQLQKQNLFSTLRAEQQAQQGFVFAEHTMPLLQMMAAHLPQVIALSDGKVIGYNLAMPVSMSSYPKIRDEKVGASDHINNYTTVSSSGYSASNFEGPAYAICAAKPCPNVYGICTHSI